MPKNPKNLSVGLVFDDSLDSSDGVAQYVKTLGSWLSRQGHQVSYLVGQTKLPSWDGGRVYSLSRNVKVSFNGNNLSMPLLSNKSQIKQVLRTEQFNVLHVMLPHSPLMAERVIKLADPTTVIFGTFHIYPASRLSTVGGRLLKRSYFGGLKRFDDIVSVSPAAQAYAKRAFGLTTEIVPNPVDLARFVSAKRPQRHQIVFLGRLVKRKGGEQLIAAFAKLSQQLPAANLVIAGDGPQRPALEKQVKKLKLDHKLKFLGYIPEDAKADLLAGADLACFPSLYGESFGIVLIEAMAAGAKLVLGGDNPGYRGVLGAQPQLLINPRRPAVLAARMAELLSDQAQAARLHKWQVQTVKQYDIEKVGPKIEAAYLAAIARRHKNRNNKGLWNPVK